MHVTPRQKGGPVAQYPDYIECAFRYSLNVYYVPTLRAGLQARDLARAIKDRFDFAMSDVFICRPDTYDFCKGSDWILPGQAVSIHTVPLGTDPFANPSTYDDEPRLPRAFRDESLLPLPEQQGTEPMPVYAVSSRDTKQIFLSRGEALAASKTLPMSVVKTFSSFEDASQYVQGSVVETDRQLMSAGSRARAAPKPYTPLSEPRAGVIEVVFEAIVDPDTSMDVIGIGVFPHCREKDAVYVYRTHPAASSASRCELLGVLDALEAAKAHPAFSDGHTTLRIASPSTLATNAVNKYARKYGRFEGRHADLLKALSVALKGCNVHARWTATRNDTVRKIRIAAVAAHRKALASP